MTRNFFLTFICLILVSRGLGQSDKTQSQDQGADPTQSFVSPLGLGTGATLAVTEKGTSVTAAVERQLVSPGVNFWQVAISGTTNKNGQAVVFSSHDADAPGFKGKIGIGKSSFIRQRPIYTKTGSDFLLQAWCRDILAVVNKTLSTPAAIPKNASCNAAVTSVKAALTSSPPADTKTRDLDTQVLTRLTDAAPDLALDAQTKVCNALKDQANVYQFCPDSGKVYKSVEEQQRAYPGLYSMIVFGQPSTFQWKLWGSWAPTLTSVDFRAVTNGVPDLATKQHWTRLLNTGVGDLALYYGKLAIGVEGGFGETVQVTTQNVCGNTIAGSFTAQKCDIAMIGRPTPTNAWMGSGTIELNPLPVLGKGALINPGVQAVFSYVAPTTGGHSSELSFPFYLAPSAKPMKFVFGLQPTWDWNTDPKVKNKFSITLFVGARPEITK